LAAWWVANFNAAVDTSGDNAQLKALAKAVNQSHIGSTFNNQTEPLFVAGRLHRFEKLRRILAGTGNYLAVARPRD
jgi:hypothetical protein